MPEHKKTSTYALRRGQGFNDWTTKEILMEVYLIDESGSPSLQLR